MAADRAARDLPGIVRLRDQQGAVTRQTILRAARELFAERGYAATPVRLLAQRAGVALQTIYATYGSKAGVLAGLPDLMDEESGIVEVFASRTEIDDPVELCGLLAKISRLLHERCGDIIGILRSGAAVDADMAGTLAEGKRRERLGVRAVVAKIGGLKEKLTIDRATDIATALMGTEIVDHLIGAGWTYDEYQKWLTETLVAALLP